MLTTPGLHSFASVRAGDRELCSVNVGSTAALDCQSCSVGNSVSCCSSTGSEPTAVSKESVLSQIID